MLSQKQTKQNLRQQCDSELALVKVQGISEASAIRLVALLIRIFNPKEDSERVVRNLNRCLSTQVQYGMVLSYVHVKSSLCNIV